MKILDETGAVVENPDLTLGYLTTSTEEITHPAVELSLIHISEPTRP